jgi:plastocyanin
MDDACLGLAAKGLQNLADWPTIKLRARRAHKLGVDMKKSGIIAIVVVVLLLIAGLVWALQRDNAPESTTKDQSDTSMKAPTDNGNGTPAKAVNQNTVSISNYEFTPASITVKAGTKVTWTNQDSVEHTVTGDGSDGPQSGSLAKGDSYSFTFDKAGTYAYHCQMHPYMKGTVTVTE